LSVSSNVSTDFSLRTCWKICKFVTFRNLDARSRLLEKNWFRELSVSGKIDKFWI
jgi:hypothetical protein